MGKWISAIGVAAALAFAAPAVAAGPLDMTSGKDWKHQQTGLSIPSKADGFVRLDARDFGSSQSDVGIQFKEDSSRTSATLYVFHAGSSSVPIWADRAESSMLANESNYGKFDRAGRLWSLFTPWRNAKDGAVRIVYPVGGTNVTSSGLLVAARGEWLIKVRMTSNTLSPAQLEAKLASFLIALKLPAAKEGPPAAYAMQPCADALPDVEAKPISRENTSAVLGAGLVNATSPGAVMAPPGSGERRGTVFCRDASTTSQYGVYRSQGRKDAYVMGIGDGGVTMTAGPDFGASVAKVAPQFSLTVITTDRAIGLVPYQTLPSPKQAFATLSNPQAVYMVSRLPGKEKDVQVVMPGK